MSSEPSPQPFRVLVAGGGVAGLETVLALRDMAGDLVSVTLLSPAPDFVYTPLSVREPFAGRHANRYPMADIAAELGFELVPDALDWVAPGQRSAFTASGREIPYDALVVALGARREPVYDGVITFRSGEDAEAMHGLVQDVEEGYSRSIAFVVPPGTTWSLPLYELALMTAERARSMSGGAALTFVTPEQAPLAVFGPKASDAVDGLLRDAGIEVHTGADATVERGSHIRIAPSGRQFDAERIVALPVLKGTAPRGLPADFEGFIPVSGHGRVVGVEDVYAAGDGVQFPVKQGGIATQQADAVAEAIARRAGAPIKPTSERPVLRGMLLTGGDPVSMRGETIRAQVEEGETAPRALWWPPAKIAGRYLAPYLAEKDGVPAEPPPPPAGGMEVEILLGSDEQPRVSGG
jgi:sulfide:quinone oxidoreductase